MKSYFQKRNLVFKSPAGTSRGILHQKPSWFIFLYDEDNPSKKGIGECSIIPGLSRDDESKIEDKLSEVCLEINKGEYKFNSPIYDFPAITFGLEMALMDFEVSGSKILYPGPFTEGKKGIPINGLVWMGDMESMVEQIETKLEQGYSCIKIKIGAINLDDEFLILRNLRNMFSANDLEIRVDANGAFTVTQAIDVLRKLGELEIHSIEQPIVPSQINDMAQLCEYSPVPIALDEELIGIHPFENKQRLVEMIKPQYLVLKPSLLGGFKETMDWINIAESLSIGWWVTSALESNIGLNAIAQWVDTFDTSMPQGLGTGSLYKENITSPLEIKNSKLFYNPNNDWSFEFVS